MTGMISARAARKLAALLVAPALLVAAACGDDSGTNPTVEAVEPPGFSASPSFLRTAAEQSAAESVRYEMWLAFEDVEPTGPPLATGSQDGDRYAMEMDLAEVMELTIEMMARMFGDPTGTGAMESERDDFTPPWLEGVDTAIELAGDHESLFMHMPFLTQLPPEELDAEARELVDLGLGDNWGYIDLTQVDDLDLDNIQDIATGGFSFDPGDIIDVVAQAEGASELEAIEVRGEAVSGITAEIPMNDLQEAYGEAPDMDLAGLNVPVDVWVDSEGYLRRISYTLDFGDMMGAIEDEALSDPAAPDDMEKVFSDMAFVATMDFFDYGQAGPIEFPTDYVDITSSADVLFDD